jgi:uncharacterized membrane protein YfcA
MADYGSRPRKVPGREVIEARELFMSVVIGQRRPLRRTLVLALPTVITLSWLVFVTFFGHWYRVVGNWESTLTMIFGSFVAGATPQGGGAVAFPVFTKVLATPAEVARTFSLSIQAVGMVTASAAIMLSGKPVEKRAVFFGGGMGVVGLLVGLLVLADTSTPFWSSIIPGPYVKVTFTIVLAALSYIVYLALEEDDCGEPEIAVWNSRMWIGVGLAGFVGGIASALLGSGTDVFVFLFIVIIAGLHPRVGVPTSVLSMAMVSMAGFVVLGIIDGQLGTMIEGSSVVAVGGDVIAAVPVERFDVFGMWIAAVPIVVWGAPLGTVFVHALGERRLIGFLAAMAAVEVISTAIFLDQLRTDIALLGFAIGGLVCGIAGVRWLHNHRAKLLRDAAPPETVMQAAD